MGVIGDAVSSAFSSANGSEYWLTILFVVKIAAFWGTKFVYPSWCIARKVRTARSTGTPSADDSLVGLRLMASVWKESLQLRKGLRILHEVEEEERSITGREGFSALRIVASSTVGDVLCHAEVCATP